MLTVKQCICRLRGLTMVGLLLYARSRRLIAAATAVVGAQLLGIVLGTRSFRISNYSETAVPWLVFLPLISAIIIGTSMRSPLTEFDATARRLLSIWRVAQLGVLSGLSTAGLILLSAGLSGPIGEIAAIRNFVGFVGLALLSGFLLGGRLAWVLPLAVAISAITLGNPVGNGFPWDWPVRFDGDFDAFATALILGFGATPAVIRGTREVRGDADG
ncbi:MAG: hypothetical protein QOE03_755 [Micromonosporaceae bacterium]|nr:hypothetical protein [Micromonosporaceae bacterium]